MRYIDADRFKRHLENAMEKMHTIGGVKAVDVGAVIRALDRQPTADVVPKSEVIEEFTNRLKERLYTIPTVYSSHFGRMIDDIATEMKGADNDT